MRRCATPTAHFGRVQRKAEKEHQASGRRATATYRLALAERHAGRHRTCRPANSASSGSQDVMLPRPRPRSRRREQASGVSGRFEPRSIIGKLRREAWRCRGWRARSRSARHERMRHARARAVRHHVSRRAPPAVPAAAPRRAARRRRRTRPVSGWHPSFGNACLCYLVEGAMRVHARCANELRAGVRSRRALSSGPFSNVPMAPSVSANAMQAPPCRMPPEDAGAAQVARQRPAGRSRRRSRRTRLTQAKDDIPDKLY